VSSSEPDRGKPYSRLQIAEATAAAVLASAIVSSAGGVFWLVVSLPTRLTHLERSASELVRLVGALEPRIDRVELKVTDHDRRIEDLER
jgi:hypothetical protein